MFETQIKLKLPSHKFYGDQSNQTLNALTYTYAIKVKYNLIRLPGTSGYSFLIDVLHLGSPDKVTFLFINVSLLNIRSPGNTAFQCLNGNSIYVMISKLYSP